MVIKKLSAVSYQLSAGTAEDQLLLTADG